MNRTQSGVFAAAVVATMAVAKPAHAQGDFHPPSNPATTAAVTPEPATIVLLAGGLAGLAGVVRYRRRGKSNSKVDQK